MAHRENAIDPPLFLVFTVWQPVRASMSNALVLKPPLTTRLFIILLSIIMPLIEV
ncbi:hypothetical protein ENHAE0001_1949 [Enhydrobacter aerosaccus SK60]|nr:hypothetical protein ENHAE0001_1949 [Enhydrobacter aerosaccus SK60]